MDFYLFLVWLKNIYIFLKCHLTYIANLKNYCKKGTQRTNLQQEMNKKN